MPRPSLLLALTAAFGLSSATARADTLVLKNGDRISGEFIRHAEGVIVFRSAALGDLQVPAHEATVTQSATPAAAHGPVVNVAHLDRPSDPRPARNENGRDWKRRVDFGLTAQDGLHEQSNYNLRLEAARATDNRELNFGFTRRYGKVDDQVLADATSATALVTHKVTEDFFLRGLTRYDRDPIVGIGHSAEQSFGLGYTLTESDRLRFDVGGGAVLRHREAYGDQARWNGLLDAFGRLRFAVTERMSLTQDLAMTGDPRRGDDFKFKWNTALVNKLTEMLNMSVRYEFERNYTATADVPDTQRLITAIGCVF